MSFSLPSKRARASRHARWTDTAVLVEAMVLVVFVVASVAIFVGLFAASLDHAARGEELARAVALAIDAAERFCADPAAPQEGRRDADLYAVCEVTHEDRPGGTMYRASVKVYALRDDAAAVPEDATPLYRLETAAYRGGGHHE